MPRDNHMYRKVKEIILNNPKPEGWTSSDLAQLIDCRTSSLRYICGQLTEQGFLVKKELENIKKGNCRVKYFLNSKDKEVYGVGMANKIDVHNIFSRPHCGGRG